jgi:hypothetical protein
MAASLFHGPVPSLDLIASGAGLFSCAHKVLIA